MSGRFVGLLAVALGSLVLSACGGAGGPKLYAVSGKVTFDGQPAAGAQVVFEPADGSALKPTGLVGADGTFTLNTHPHGDGAPAGDYKVAVLWFPNNARSLENAKSKLPARYGDAGKSGLTATVKPEANELPPFALTK